MLSFTSLVSKPEYAVHLAKIAYSGNERSEVYPIGLVIYRFGATLFYANASLFGKEVRGLVGPAPSSVRWLVVDAEAITNVDYTAARMIRQLHDELVRRGVLLAFARVSSSLKADLDRHRLTEVIGPARLFDRLHDALAAFGKWRESASQAERDSRHEKH